MAEQTPSREPQRRLRAVVRGHVQAVGFRQFVWDHARRLGLAGWVRNGDDGRSVELEAEGAAADVERLLDLLRPGPYGARVDRLDVEWDDDLRSYRGFEVRF